MFNVIRLLGLNGAGKTTTLEILTGELYSTSGHVYLNGCDIETKRAGATKSLGYCPQFDSLAEYLSVEQCLQLFANLRGVRRDKVDVVVREFISLFKLDEYRHKLVQNLRWATFHFILKFLRCANNEKRKFLIKINPIFLWKFYILN